MATTGFKRPSHGKLKLANSRWRSSKSRQTCTLTRQTRVKSEHSAIYKMAALVQWHSRRTLKKKTKREETKAVEK